MSGSHNQRESRNEGNPKLPSGSSKDERPSPIFDTPRRKHSLQSTNEIDFNSRSECASREFSDPQTPTRENESFSRDTLNEEDCSQAQSPLQAIESFKVTPVQRTKSPLSELTSERTRFSHEKSMSPAQCNLVTSSSKRNRFVPFEKTTTDVRSPLLISPSSSVVSIQSTSPVNVRSPMGKSAFTTVPSPLSNCPSKTIGSLVSTSPSPNSGSPQAISSSTIQSFSKDTSDGVSPVQSSLPKALSIVKRKNSPFKPLLHRRIESQEKLKALRNAEDYNFKESPTKGNQLVDRSSKKIPSRLSISNSVVQPYLEALSLKVESPQSILPSATDRKHVSTSPSLKIRSPQSKKFIKKVRSPQSKKTIKKVQSPQSKKAIKKVRSPQSKKAIKKVRSPQSKKTIKKVQSPKSIKAIKKVRSPQSKKTIKKIRSPQSKKAIKKVRSPKLEKATKEVRSFAATSLKVKSQSSPSGSSRSPLETSSSTTVYRTLPSKNSASLASTSPTTNIQILQLKEPLMKVRSLPTSPSSNVSLQSISPSAKDQKHVSNLPSCNIPPPQSKKTAMKVGSPTSPKNVSSPLEASPFKTVRCSLSFSTETVGSLVSIPPSQKVEYPQSTPSKTIADFSKKNSEGVSPKQLSLQKYYSRMKSPAQKKSSQKEGLTSKRTRSFEESPSKRNRSVDMEENTIKVESSLTMSPSAIVQSPLSTSTSGKFRSPFATSSPGNVQSQLATSRSANVQSPLNQSSPISSPLTAIFPQAELRTASKTTVKDAFCQVNLCCCENLIKLSPKSSSLTTSNSTFGEIMHNIKEFMQCFNLIWKSASKERNHEGKKVPDAEKCEDATTPVPEQILERVNTDVSSEFSLSLLNSQEGRLNEEISDLNLDMVKKSNQNSPITNNIFGVPLKCKTKIISYPTLVHKNVLFASAGSCGKTSLILKMFNQLDHYDQFRTKPTDYSFFMRFEDQNKVINVTFRDSDTKILAARWERYCQYDFFVMCFAVNDADSYYKLIGDIRTKILSSGSSAPMILVGLKSDLRDTAKRSENSLVYKEFINQTWKALGFISYSECSIYNDSYTELYDFIKNILKFQTLKLFDFKNV